MTATFRVIPTADVGPSAHNVRDEIPGQTSLFDFLLGGEGVDTSAIVAGAGDEGSGCDELIGERERPRD